MQTFRANSILRLTIVGCVVSFSIATAQESETKPQQTQVIKLFSLSNASSAEVMNVLRIIFGGKNVSLAADKRTNTLIVKAPQDAVEMLEAVLLKLDEKRGKARPTATAAIPPSGKSVISKKLLTIRCEVPVATIKEMLSDGKPVKKGDLLMQLDDSELVAELEGIRTEITLLKAGDIAMAEQNLKASEFGKLELGKLKITELHRKHIDAELELARNALEGEITVAAKALEVARTRYERLAQLVANGQASSDESEASSLEVVEAEVAYKLAVAKRKVFVDVTRVTKIAEAELEVEMAKLNLMRAERETAIGLERARAELNALNTRLDRQTARMARLKSQIEKCRVHAPADGVVRFKKLQVGAIVRKGQPLAVIESP